MRKIIMTLIVCSLVICMGETVMAAQSENVGLSVTPINPQTGKPLSSFYDLKVKPNEKITLPLDIQNSSEKEMTINVGINDGTTNDNGITAYDGLKKRDSSLKVSFTDIATIESERIVVKKDSKVRVNIKVKVPEEAFSGVILGGLRVSEEEATGVNEDTAAITNNIAYVIGVVLRESDEEQEPSIALNKVITEQRNYRNYISANLQNKAPRIIKKMTTHAKVYKKNSNKLLYEASNEAIRMAPHSNFNFGINLGEQAFIPGDYTIVIDGKADGKSYSFTKDFVIKGKTAKDMNKNAVFVEDNKLSMWWLVGAGMIIIIFLIIILKLWRREKHR